MIKIVIAFFTIITLASPDWHNYSVPKIEGGTQQLSEYNNIRLIIVTLPVQQSPWADSLLYTLDTIATVHAGTHKVIGIPSIEDGFSPEMRATLSAWYRTKLSDEVLITDGIYTRKTSTLQHDLFKWLTDKSHNGIFDIGPDAAGYKYFVMPDGKLNSVLQPSIPVWGGSVNRALTIQID